MTRKRGWAQDLLVFSVNKIRGQKAILEIFLQIIFILAVHLEFGGAMIMGYNVLVLVLPQFSRNKILIAHQA